MEFRERLIGTLRGIQSILDVPGVIVVGSEVPNLLLPPGQAQLVVSQDVDIGISIPAHGQVVECLRRIAGFRPSPAEPSVWVPLNADLIEVNFLGIDPTLSRIEDTYVFENAELPLLVFGPLSLVRVTQRLMVDGVRMTVPRPAGLLIEKLVTERVGEKGDRDLLVALGLLLVMDAAAVEEAVGIFGGLSGEQQRGVMSNLALLSLLAPRTGMPDPVAGRRIVAALMTKLESALGVTR